MIEIPVELKAGRVRDFLDYLRVVVTKNHKVQGKGGGLEDGRFKETAVVTPRENGDILTEITLEIVWNTDGTLEPITAEASHHSSRDWEQKTREWVNEALVKTINAERERHFIVEYFHYFGPQLSGEYWIEGTRVAPTVVPDIGLLDAERVLELNMFSEGVDRAHAVALGKVKAERFASLLSCFVPMALFRPLMQNRWVYADSNRKKSERRNLGFSPQDRPKRMPRKAERCRLGEYENVDRADLVKPVLKTELRFPSDLRELFRRYRLLEGPKQAAFLGAANLHRLANTAGSNCPSLRMAYVVAAVDALLIGQRHDRAGFIDLVHGLCPEVQIDDVKVCYDRMRSAHLHTGLFPGGEYDPYLVGPFAGPEAISKVTRSCFITASA